MLSEFFQLWHIAIGSVGCVANLLLCYAALFRTPKATRSYATFILNFAITDFAECFLDLFLQPRFILTPVNGVLIYVFHGVCRFTGAMSCKIGVSVLLHCFPHSAWSLLLSFTYRFYILHHPPVPRKILVIIILLVYMPSLFQAMTFWTAFVNRETILPIAEEYFPHYNLSQETGTILGVTSIKSFPVIFLIIHLCVPIFPIYITIFIMRAKIVKNLMEKASIMSQDTRAGHKQILKCLTIQAFIPTLFVIAIVCYIIAQLGILTHPVLEYMIYASILPMPMLSPFTYLVYVRPYRLFCRRLLTQKSVGQNRSVRFESTAQGSSGGPAKKYAVPPNT